MLPAAEGTGMPVPSQVWGPFPAREGGLGKGEATGTGVAEERGGEEGPPVSELWDCKAGHRELMCLRWTQHLTKL